MIVKRYSLALVKEPGIKYDGLNEKYDNAQKIFDLMCNVFHADTLPEEHIWLVTLNNHMKLTGVSEVSMGTFDKTTVPIREILSRVLLSSAQCFLLVHNHPGGDQTPSVADIDATKQIMSAAEILHLTMLDHIIVGDGFYTNIRNYIEEGF